MEPDMARKASKAESTQAAVEVAAERHKEMERATDDLASKVAERSTTIVTGVTADDMRAAWQAVQADVKAQAANHALTDDERVSAIVRAVEPFLAVARQVEGPGVEALQRATQMARQVDGYRQRVARLLTSHDVPPERVAEVCGFSVHRARQYRSAHGVQTMARKHDLTLSARDAEALAENGKVKAAQAAIRQGKQAALDAIVKPETAPADGKVERRSDADAILSAAQDMLKATEGVTLNVSDLETMGEALATLAKARRNLETLRTGLTRQSAEDAA